MCLIEGFMALPSDKADPHEGKQPGAPMKHYVWRYVHFLHLLKISQIYVFQRFYSTHS